MKHLLLTTIAAVVLVGCGEAQQSSPAPEANPVESVAEVPAQASPPPVEAKPTEPVAEAAQPEPPTAKAPDISIHAAARQGKIEAVKQHLTDGVGVNAKSEMGRTTLHSAAREGHKEVIELLIAKGADVNVKDGPIQRCAEIIIHRIHIRTSNDKQFDDFGSFVPDGPI